ncbi:hypothetical protein CAPTEDRAFT_225676 [Capitella teleta]|uniref:F-box domain-containing protein n=1 Tax=Capitella teleta TaxID=283909 RepID=R7VE10_CAPTE|nr:hypothetical protein CAPTEDRAFT_225676 [Capitella teleta]|eukprot:ELU16864.1 hypothetical protein CAPTEDRAFT_225676 [Capitella teleta]
MSVNPEHLSNHAVATSRNDTPKGNMSFPDRNTSDAVNIKSNLSDNSLTSGHNKDSHGRMHSTGKVKLIDPRTSDKSEPAKEINVVLEEFRAEWKQEITKQPLSGPAAAKDSPRHDDDKSIKIEAHSSKELSRNHFTSQVEESRRRRNEIPAFIITEELLKKGSGPKSFEELEAIAGNQSTASCSTSREEYFLQKKRIKLSTEAPMPVESESILDLFLSDLAEVEDIPFFDIDLPRELAMKIFQYLDARDLCRCCQVSRAWKSLAEDDFLWSEICHRFGWEQNSSTIDHQEWKEVVREHVTRENDTQYNWKMRYGAFQQLEYVQGGVLSAVNSTGNSVVAGFSNGEVHFWDVEEGEERTFSPSSQALTLMDSDGSIPNYVFSVAVSPHFTAGYFSSGTLDIWKNDGRKSVHHTIPNAAHLWENKRVAAAQNSDIFVYSYGSTVKKISINESDVSSREVIFEGQVADFKSVPSNPDFLAITSRDTAAVHNWRQGSYRVMHNSIMQTITAMDANQKSLALGINTQFGASKVRIYDLCTGREEGDFKGLCSSVDVINMEFSPTQSFVVGSNCRASVFDTRSPDPVVTLGSIESRVHCVQMDEWKVVAGSTNGLVGVWDLRTNSRLWEAHNRHSVRYLHFWNQYLLTANLRPHQDLVDLENAFDGVAHRRDRGCINIYDFSQKVMREGLPDICHSEFNDPEAFNYNIRLAVPYDNI